MSIPFVLLVSQAAPLQCPANGSLQNTHNTRFRTARAATDAPAAGRTLHGPGAVNNEQADAALLLEAAAAVLGPSDWARSKPRKQRHPKMSAVAAGYDPKIAKFLKKMYETEATERAAARDAAWERAEKQPDRKPVKKTQNRPDKEEQVMKAGAGKRKGSDDIQGKQKKAPAKKHRAREGEF